MMNKKTYVIDTNVFLRNPHAYKEYYDHDIVIPFKVLEEVDKFKKGMNDLGKCAREFVRFLEDLRVKGNLERGVSMGQGKGLLSIKFFSGTDRNKPSRLSRLDMSVPDNVIIAVADNVRQEKRTEVIVVSRDINMRIKCDSLGVKSENYTTGKVVKNLDEIYSGQEVILFPEEDIDAFYAGDEIFLEKLEDEPLYMNQFITLQGEYNSKKTAFARFVGYDKPLRKVETRFKEVEKYGLKPKNREQIFALDLLMDPNVPLVTLNGKAGTGKTLVTIAAALAQTLGGNLQGLSMGAKGKRKFKGDLSYKSTVITKPVIPVGNDVGFLPGDLNSKLQPYLSSYSDNIEFLVGDRETAYSLLYDSDFVEIEAITYVRGRSFNKKFLIVDEAQNISIHELKTILTRIGNGAKVVLLGDVEQIDSRGLDGTSNGLTVAIEKFKKFKLCGHVTLTKGVRSPIAELAANVL